MSTSAPKSIDTKSHPAEIKDLQKPHWEALASGVRKAAVGIDAATSKAALEAMRTDPATKGLDLTDKTIVTTDTPDEIFKAGLMGDGIVLHSSLVDKSHPMAAVLDGRKGSHSIVMAHSQGAPKGEIANARTRVIDGTKALANKDATDPADATKFLTAVERATAAAEEFKKSIHKKEEISFVACDIKDDKLMVEKTGKHCIVYIVDADGSKVRTTKKGALTREPGITSKKADFETIPFDLAANQVVVVVDGDVSEDKIKAAVKEAGGNLPVIMAKLLAGTKNIDATGAAANSDKPLNISLYIHKPSEPAEALNTKPDIVEKEKKAVAVTRASLREALNTAREQVANLDPFLRPAREEVRSAETRQEREAYVAANLAKFDTVEKQKAYIDGPQKKGIAGLWEGIANKFKNRVGFLSKAELLIDVPVAAVDTVLFGIPQAVGKFVNDLGEKAREGLWAFAESRDSEAGKWAGRVLAKTLGEAAHITLGIAGTVPRVAGVIGSYVLNMGVGTIKELAIKGFLGGLSKKVGARKKKNLEAVFNLDEFWKTNTDLKAVYDKLGEVDSQAQMNLLRQLQEKNNEVRRTQAKQAWEEDHSPEREFAGRKWFDKWRTKGIASRYAQPRGRVAEFLVNGNEGFMAGPFRIAFPGFAKIPLFRDVLFRREPHYDASGNFVRDDEGHIRQDFLLDVSIGRAVKELLIKTDALADRWDAARRVDMADAVNGLHPEEMRHEMMRIIAEFTDEAIASKKTKKPKEAREARKMLNTDPTFMDRMAPELASAPTRRPRDNAQCKELVNTLIPGVDAAFATLQAEADKANTLADISTRGATGSILTGRAYEVAKDKLEQIIGQIKTLKSHPNVLSATTAGAPSIEVEFDKYVAELETRLKTIEDKLAARFAISTDSAIDAVFAALPDAAKQAQLNDILSQCFTLPHKAFKDYQKNVNLTDPTSKTTNAKIATDAFDLIESGLVTKLKTDFSISDTEAAAFAAKVKMDLNALWNTISADANVTQARESDQAKAAIDKHITENINHASIAEKAVTDSLDTYEKFLENIVAARETGGEEPYNAVVAFSTDLKKIGTDLETAYGSTMPPAVINELDALQVKLIRQAERIASLRDRTVDTYNRRELVGSMMTGLDRSGLSELAKTMRDRFALMTGKAAAKKLAIAPSLSVLAVAAVSTAVGKVAAARVHEGVRDAMFSKLEKDDKGATAFKPLVAEIVAKGKFLGMQVPAGIGEMLAKATSDTDEDKKTREKAAEQLENWISRVISNIVDGHGVSKLADELFRLVPAKPTVDMMIPVDPADPTGPQKVHPEWENLIAKSQSVGTIISRLISGISANRIAVKEDLLGSITSRGAGAAVVDKLYAHLQTLEVLLGAKAAELQKERVLAQAGFGQAAKAGINAIIGGAKDAVFDLANTGTQIAGSAGYMGPAMLVDTAVLHYVTGGIAHGLTAAHLPNLAHAYEGMVHVAEAPAHVLGSMGPDSIAHGLDTLTGQPAAARDAGPVQVLHEIGQQLARDAQQSNLPRVAQVLGRVAGTPAHADPAQRPTSHPNAPLQPAAPGATAPHAPLQSAASTAPNADPFYTPAPRAPMAPSAEAPIYNEGPRAPLAPVNTGPDTPRTGPDAPSAEQPADPSANPVERPAVVTDTEGYVEAGTVTAGNIDRGREGRMMAVLDARYPELTDHQRNYIANSLQNSSLVRAARDSAHQGHSRVGDQIDVRINGDMVDVRFHRPAGRGHEASTAVAHVPLAGLLGNTHLAPTDRTQMQAVLSHGPAAAAPAAPAAPAAADPAPATGTDRQHGSGRHGRHGGGQSGSGTGGSHHREGGQGSADHRQDRPATTAEVRTASPDTLTPEATTNLVSYLRNAVTLSGVTMQPVANETGRIEVSYGSPARTFNINVQYHPSTGQAETLATGMPVNDAEALDVFNRVDSRIMQVYATRHNVLERVRGLNRPGVSFGVTNNPNEIQVRYHDSRNESKTAVFEIVQRDNNTATFTTIPAGTPPEALALMREVESAINQSLPSIALDTNNHEVAIDSDRRTEVVENLRDELSAMAAADYQETIRELESNVRTAYEDDERTEVQADLDENRKSIVVEPTSGVEGGITVTYSDAQGVRQTLAYRVTRDGEKVVLHSPTTTDSNRDVNTRTRQAILNFLNDGDVTIQEETATTAPARPATTVTAPVQASTASSPASTPAANPAPAPTPSPTPAPAVTPTAPVNAARQTVGNAVAQTNTGNVETVKQVVTNAAPAAAATAAAPAAPQNPEAAVRSTLSGLMNSAIRPAATPDNASTPTAAVAGTTPTAENPLPDFDPDNNHDELPGNDDGTPPTAPTGGSGGNGPRPAGTSGGTDRPGERATGPVSRVAGARTEAPSTPAPAAQAERAPEAPVTRPTVDAAEIGHPSSLSIRRAVVEAYNQEAAVNQHLRLEARSGRAGLIDIQGTGTNTTDRITVMTHPEADGSLRVIRVIVANGTEFVDNAEHRNAALANKPLREVLAVLSSRIAPQSEAAIHAINESRVTMNIVHARTEAYNSDREAAARIARFRGQVTIGELEHEFHNADSVAVGQWLDRVNTETRIATVRSDLQGSGYLMDAIREFVSTAHNNNRVTLEQYPWARNITEERVLRAVASALNEDGTLTAKELARSLGIPYNDDTTSPDMQTFLVPLREIAEYAGTHLRLTPQLAANADSADQVEDEREARSERDIDDPEDTYARGGHNRVVAVIHSIADVSGDETITAPNIAEADGDELVMTNMTTTITESGIRGRLDDLLRSHRTANGFDDAAFVRDLEELRRSGERYMASDRARSLHVEIPEGRNSPVALAASFEDALDDRQRMAIRFGIALGVERHSDVVSAVAGSREVGAREAAPRNQNNELVTALSEADRTVLNSVRGDLPAHTDLSAYSPEQLHQLATSLRDRINDASRAHRAISVVELTMLGRVSAVEAQRQLLTTNIDTIAQDIAARINEHADGNADMAVSAGRIREQLLHFAAGGLFNFHNGSPSFQGAGVGLSREFPFTSDNGRHNFTLGLDLGVGGSVDGVGVGGGVHGTYSYRITHGLDFVSGIVAGAGTANLNPGVAAGIFAGVRANISGGLDAVALVNGSIGLGGVGYGALLGLQYNPAHAFENMMSNLQREVGATVRPENGPPEALLRSVVSRYGIAPEENSAAILANHDELVRRYALVFQGLENTSLEGSVHNGISGGGITVGMFNGIPYILPYLRITFGAGVSYEIQQAPDGQLHQTFRDAFQEAVRTASRNPNQNGTTTIVTRMSREVTAPQVGMDQQGQAHVINGTGRIRETVLGGVTDASSRERAINAAMSGAHLRLDGNRITINDPDEQTEYRIVNAGVAGINLAAAQDGRSANLTLPSSTEFTIVRIRARGLTPNAVNQDAREIIMFCPATMSTADMQAAAEEATLRTREYVAIRYLNGQAQFTSGVYDTRNQPQATVASAAPNTATTLPVNAPTANRDGELTAAEMGDVIALDARVAPADRSLELAVYQYMITNQNAISAFRNRSDERAGDEGHLAEAMARRIVAIQNALHQPSFRYQGTRAFSAGYNMERLIDALTDAANISDISNKSLPEQRLALHRRLRVAEENFAAIHPRGDASARAGLHESNVRMRAAANRLQVHIGESAVAGLTEYTAENLRARHLEMPADGSHGYIVVGREQGGFTVRRVPGGRAVITMAEHYNLHTGQRDGEAMSDNEKAMVRMFLRETYPESDAFRQGNALYLQMLTATERGVLDSVQTAASRIRTDIIGRMPAGSTDAQKEAAVAGALEHDTSYQALIHAQEYVRLTGNRDQFIAYIRDRLEHGVDQFPVTMPGNRTYTIHLESEVLRGIYVADSDPNTHAHIGHCGNEFVSSNVRLRLTQEGAAIQASTPIDMAVEFGNTSRGTFDSGTSFTAGVSNTISSDNPVPDHTQGGRDPDHRQGGNVNTVDTPAPGTSAGPGVDTYGAPSTTPGTGTQPGTAPQAAPQGANNVGAGVDTY